MWFDYPIHKPDETGTLKDLEPESERSPRQAAIRKQQQTAKNNISSFHMAYNSISVDHPPTVAEIAETT